MSVSTEAPNSFEIKERQFEADIEAAMANKGWQKVDSNQFNKEFDPALGLNPTVFTDFIKASQPQEWKKYEKIYPADAEKKIVERLDQRIHKEGLLHILRYGFKDHGIRFHAMFRQPETDMNATARMQYEANIFQIVRQLHYSSQNTNSLDIVLFVNGIPIISEELKCQFTGQNTDNAINQYKFDRAGKERIFTFKERILAHFAVDLTSIYMTTRLQGSDTYFLPFNQGSGGAGKVGGKGNPGNADGYATSYLWEQVLTPEGLTEILFKYLHLEKQEDAKGKNISERIIFPRYHQLDVVTKLLADVKAHGSGKNYLIEHSAGSGKSNSIAWLAHRLSGLHDENDKKIFQSVIIVTDRRVLDNQLQNTVYQFDHQPGVVQKIDKDSKQLREAIESGAGIIITTLQKFPVIYKEINSGSKRFAVIVDEAHSSQTGNAAKKLKYALADRKEVLRREEEEDSLLENALADAEEEAARSDATDPLLDELAAHGQQKNLSFFAFTATPKEKTLEMFGTRQEDGSFRPFHVYSMRQAIEEGFILDVLQNYMTYRMYYSIAKTIEDDPDMDAVAGARAVTNFEMLHPHNIAQKAAVILDHYDAITSHKIGGKAKAMVVTSSRLHALRYTKELRRQIEKRGMADRVGVLIAFSGELEDGGVSYTEEKVNVGKDGKSIRESALPQEFHKDDYALLVVAEKYQTGFDEPLLHTMFVDKKLSGVKAVQTLSRLNRTARGKTDTFVLDFANTAEEIQKSFQPYYEEAVLETCTDPNLAADLKEELMGFQIIDPADYEHFADLYYSSGDPESKNVLGKLQGCLDPALTRFQDMQDNEKKDQFKKLLARFNRFYAFITQVYRDFDKDLLRFSIYARFLAKFLPKGASVHEDVNDKVLLKYYKLEKDFDGAIDLHPGKDEPFSPATGGTGSGTDKELTSLAAIIDRINSKYGTEFTEMDKVLLQIREDVLKIDKWEKEATTNSLSMFTKILRKDLETAIVNRVQQNNEFFEVMTTNASLYNDVLDGLMREIYDTYRLRSRQKQASEEDIGRTASAGS